MEYKVEEISPVERKIVVDIPVEEVNASITATVALYKTSVDIKGFRKGKVPSSLIESRFRDKIYQEATGDLINYQLNEILGETKLQPLSRLDVDAKELVRGESFTYTVSFEVAPDFELPEYGKLEVEQEAVAVDSKEIEDVIERIRTNLAELKDVEEDRVAQDGDVAIINFNAWQEDKALDEIKADNFQLPLGDGQALEGFEDIVKKLKKGENGEGDITFPEDFINKDYAGQTVTMRVKLVNLKQRILPEVDDEFAKKAGGFPSVEKMREAIESSYMTSRKNLVKAAAEKKLLDGLMEKTDFMLPPALVEENIDRMILDLKARVESQGRRIETLGKTPEELREEYKPKSEELVRTQLFLLAVAKKEELKVENQEVDTYIYQEALRQRQDPETLRRQYEDNNLMFALRDRLLADKAMELIYSQAEVKEVPAAELKKEEKEEK
ncbi:trigger factor [Desulfobaculum bizertense]|uniref:Trigger factor n=1 Tax=Desulfobaculum bizertense DSM 18034 TaxID=1121442 RepID=A0A1T4W6E8_9BACT|nr:trigger factor [Desulfobaculum bizertense]UIJ39029.1 trigger factor [Desulfobaculum bizertense]SKA72806.1 trigger factor [Desulfobaculum bizertense DSM 18034]